MSEDEKIWAIRSRDRLGTILRADQARFADLLGLAGLDWRVDLAGTSLAGLDLDHIALREADLGEAELSGTSLAHADLSCACLVRADLDDADLRYADLRGANLREANLRNACLCHARIEGADFTGADLRGANLEGIDTDLLEAQGADKASEVGAAGGMPGGPGFSDPAMPIELCFPFEAEARMVVRLAWRLAAMGRDEDEEWLDMIPYLAENDRTRHDISAERARLARMRPKGDAVRAHAMQLGRLNHDLALIHWWRGKLRAAEAHAGEAMIHTRKAGLAPLQTEAALTEAAIAVARADWSRVEQSLTPVKNGKISAQIMRAHLISALRALEMGKDSGSLREARLALDALARQKEPVPEYAELRAILALIEALARARAGETLDMMALAAHIDHRTSLREPYRDFLACARAPARRITSRPTGKTGN